MGCFFYRFRIQNRSVYKSIKNAIDMEKVLLQWQVRVRRIDVLTKNNWLIGIFILSLLVLLFVLMFREVITNSEPWWVLLGPGIPILIFFILIITSFMFVTIEYMMTDEGITKLELVLWNKLLLVQQIAKSWEQARVKYFGGNQLTTNVYIPYEAVENYTVRENKIILRPKIPIVPFVIIPNEHEKKIISILQSKRINKL